MLLELKADNYPAIHFEEPIIYFRSNFTHVPGDFLKVYDTVVLVVEAYHQWNGPRNWKCAIKADTKVLEKIRKALSFSMIPRPYSIIYADPPWNFDTYSDKGKDRSAENHYPVMSIADICRLPVKELRANDCILFLWANGPRLFEAEWVIEEWGFTYKSIGFVWVKTTKDGSGYPIGTGYWTRQNPELCLIATHGHPKRIDASVPTLIFEPRREHSRKPDCTRDKIIQLVGDLPRIELFARHRFEGWDAWGNEVESDIQFV